MTTAKAGDDGRHEADREESLASLLNRVLQISVDIYNQDAGAHAITHRQFDVLRALDGHEGISQTELTRRSGIDRSTLADLLARMVRKGLVRREPAAGDARIRHVWLDAAGRAILAETEPHVRGADEKVLALMSPSERASFMRLLRTLAGVQRAPAPAVIPGSMEAGKAEVCDEAAAGSKKAGKKRKRPYVLEDLPMPPLSAGAMADKNEKPAVKWKAPKPIWKVGR